ncbi:Asp-tRNA(Asn)/Glu-tRNA(Gln) amidotransferase subunit GatA [candidate division KSB1 bacterium]|nr:Asp-tRNA(Asn)/Glu-tRNA(Gln) amidotransferase subunit GatA [candidate division KSB1 bacterium]
MREKSGSDLAVNSYSEIRNEILSRNITCTALTAHYLEKMDEGRDMNAFISFFSVHAMQQAEQVDLAIQNGNAGALAGLILAVKDNIVIEGQKATCGSNILNNFVSPYTATVIERLESAGAIIVGKTNMDEFAMGSSNETSHYGVVRNPLDPERVPGGSSGGSAAAVAANMCLAALGSDTGGSIRQPASFCGVVGIKPTYGRVSRYGLVAYGSSFDQIGPITRSVEDNARILQCIAGFDERDSTSADMPVPDYTTTLGQDVNGITIGLPKEYMGEGLQPDIQATLDETIQLLEQAGATIKPISLPHTEYAIADYYILVTAEASSNLERYDGVRYGHRSREAASLEEMYVNSRSEGFGAEVKRRIMLGSYVLSAGYYDAYYRKAQKVRRLISNDFHKAFETCDCLLTPTAPSTAFKIGEKTDDPLHMYLSDIYTVPINLAGIPAIAVPCGTDNQNLPIGLQLMAKPFDEPMIYRVAHFLEQAQR